MTVPAHPLLEPEAACLVQSYGIPYPDHALVHTPEEAALAAEKLGGPVVLKVVSPDIPHKSDVGGVMTGLIPGAMIRPAAQALFDRVRARCPQSRLEGLLVCRQAEPGLELIAGGIQDLTFGPVVMLGLGGIYAEVLRDVVMRVSPLERGEAEEMLHELRAYPLLAGARGQQALDRAALVDLLLAVSRLMDEHREVQDLDLNPVRLYPRGLQALDVRIMIKPESH